MAYRDWGAKTGGGGVASKEHENLARKERLRQLASDTVDLKNDPYFMRNHLGTYECKLCLTLHANEGNYLAHAQGRRHQGNLKRRAAMESKKEAARPRAPIAATVRAVNRKRMKIGRPGYRITKQREPETRQLSLLFQIRYPEIAEGLQPRHRFMSAFEQVQEKPNRKYQYLLFAAEPYETVGFKIPNIPIDKSEGKFYTNWDKNSRKFTLQLYFENRKTPLGSKNGDTADSPSDNSKPNNEGTEKPRAKDPFAGINHPL